MKKLSLVLNLVLVIAVAALFYLHFGGTPEPVKGSVEGTQTTSDFQVAYVNIDTLIANYQMYIDKRDKLMEKRDESEAELQGKSQSFERDVRDFQNKVQKELVTRTKAQMMQQELGQREQELYQMKDQLSYKLAEEEQVMNRQVLNAIMDYLEKYNKDHGYDYILSNAFGGPLLYSNEALNITQQVLVGLNETYEKDNK
ncbi:MAG: OmpH family outer membrane protein [Bacteroidales bacterium]